MDIKPDKCQSGPLTGINLSLSLCKAAGLNFGAMQLNFRFAQTNFHHGIQRPESIDCG